MIKKKILGDIIDRFYGLLNESSSISAIWKVYIIYSQRLLLKIYEIGKYQDIDGMNNELDNLGGQITQLKNQLYNLVQMFQILKESQTIVKNQMNNLI